MNKTARSQDDSVEKIHREEGLDDNENDYNLNKTLSDSNLSEAEEEKDSEDNDMKRNHSNIKKL